MNPQSSSLSLNTLLQTGTIDAIIDPTGSITTSWALSVPWMTDILQGGGLVDTIFNMDALAALPTDHKEALVNEGLKAFNNNKSQWDYDEENVRYIAGAWGINYPDQDSIFTNQLIAITAPSLDDWATEHGPNARKWLGKAQEILGR